jgi:hypothetical protein
MKRRHELFKKGFSVGQVARMEGTNCNSIRSWAVSEGYAKGRMNDLLTDEVLTKAIESGKSCNEIAVDFGFRCPSTIRNRVAALGLRARKATSPWGTHTYETAEPLREYYDKALRHMVVVYSPAYAHGVWS